MKLVEDIQQKSRWSVALAVSLLAAVLGLAANNSDIPNVSSSPISYSSEVVTPILSARRIPETIQADFAADDIAVDIKSFLDSSPESTCLAVVRDETVILEQRNLELGLIPASNQKIITTYAALNILGPDYKFITNVYSSEPIENGVVENLYLQGGGDPFLSTSAWWDQYDLTESRFNTSLEELADRTVNSGIKKISGSIVGDETRFDMVRQGPWDQRLIDQNQSGPLSALSVNQGYSIWAENLSLVSREVTNAPAVNSVNVFVELLKERGVEFDGEIVVAETPEDLTLIASISSETLDKVITHINSYSSNFGAEMLAKEIGYVSKGVGSTSSGAEAIFEFIQEKNFPTESVIISDGSGLSERNRLTCGLLINILGSQGPESVLANSFAIGGVRGSLEDDFKNSLAEGLVYAKTGTLRSVVALSGYVQSSVEEEIDITFTYISNEPAVSGRTIELQETLVTDFASYPEGPQLSELSPKEVLKVEE